MAHYQEEIKILWTEYIKSINYDHIGESPPTEQLVQRFGCREYIKYQFLITPRIHLIGNIFAHYLQYLLPSDPRYAMDSWDMVTFAWFSGLNYESILDHIHDASFLLLEVERMELAWLNFQVRTLHLSKTYNSPFITNIKLLLAYIHTRQCLCECSMKNYNRKITLLFRLFHSKNNPSMLPTLRWGSENQWIKDLPQILRTGCTKLALQRVLEEYHEYDNPEFYGHACSTEKNVCYVHHACKSPFLDEDIFVDQADSPPAVVVG